MNKHGYMPPVRLTISNPIIIITYISHDWNEVPWENAFRASFAPGFPRSACQAPSWVCVRRTRPSPACSLSRGYAGPARSRPDRFPMRSPTTWTGGPPLWLPPVFVFGNKWLWTNHPDLGQQVGLVALDLFQGGFRPQSFNLVGNHLPRNMILLASRRQKAILIQKHQCLHHRLEFVHAGPF